MEERDKYHITGVPPHLFERYGSWRNTDDTCGAWAAAVMLAYFQDYLDAGILTPRVREAGGQDPARLVNALKYGMHGGRRTIPPDVRRGINRLFSWMRETAGGEGTRWRAAMWVGFCRARIERELRAGRPCCIGMLRLTGSRYGNHWVTAYAYEDTPDGRVYLAHDNWGNSCARIPARWVNSMICLRPAGSE